jgi:hypothetical protein
MTSNSTANNVIREFVQKHLGCACPDEVFNNIVITDGGTHFDTDTDLYQIGGRLLVAVLMTQDWHQICARLERMVETGKRMRDQHGYNRFRLVIATGDRDADNMLQRAFSDCQNTDDKIHLHVIHPRLLPTREQARN